MTAIEHSAQHPDLLYQSEEPGYRLCLRLANNQMECLGDLEFYSPAVEPELEATDVREALQQSAADAERTEREAQGCAAVDQADSFAVSGESASADEKSQGTPTAEETSAEETAVGLPAEESPASPIITPAELIQLLHNANIKQGIDFAALYDFCAAVAEKRDQQAVLLATGVEPITGADGWFELAVKTSGEQAEFQEDERGRVDLRTRHAYTEIEAGQKIGILHPPKEGIPGQTVHGLPIPAERGRIYSLIAGDGVELKYDGRIAFAEKAGRALLERQVLSVVDQLVVGGDLDLQTGNIDFHGFVEVKGDVLDDFHIKATKGIKVQGVVGACRLESSGPVEIGSMAGKEVGEISCRGDLVAGFLNQAAAACFGDVLVKNEIRNSVVKATGRIVVERGSIIGGRCVALEGIEAKVVGAPSGLTTRLVAGAYFPDAERFEFLQESLKAIDEQVKKLKSVIGPLEKLRDIKGAMARRLAILSEHWEKLEVEREVFSAELAASTRQEQSTCNPKINVGSELREGVIITLGNVTEKITLARKGPLSVIENSKTGGFRFLSQTPLQKAAQALEREILEQEVTAEAKAAATLSAAKEKAAAGKAAT